MGSLYRRTSAKKIPARAKVFTKDGVRVASWKGRDGRTRTVEVKTRPDGTEYLLVPASTFTAKFSDGQGITREVSTGCRDEVAAHGVLAALERRGELVRTGVISAAEEHVAAARERPLEEHVDAYISHLEGKGNVSTYTKPVKARLLRVAKDLQLSRLADLSGEGLEGWLRARTAEGMSAGLRNEFRGAWVRFGNWAIRTRRLVENPFRYVPLADAKADPRRQRRALTEEELVRLLKAARERPLKEALTFNRGARQGEEGARVKDHVKLRLELLGLERATIYKTLFLTGLRRGELESITIAQVDLASKVPHLILEAADEKNRSGSTLALRADLVADLRTWLERKLEALQLEARRRRKPIPMRLDSSMPLFVVPKALVKIFDRDLTAAKIDKRDARGRTVDVHALRTTFGTHLSKGGVPLRTAQAAMRHSDPSLTANVYTDPQLLDVRGALDALPSLPLAGSADRDAAQATRTDGAPAMESAQDALRDAPTPVPPCHFVTVCDSLSSEGQDGASLNSSDDANSDNSDFAQEKASLAEDASEAYLVDLRGVEPLTSALRTQRSPN